MNDDSPRSATFVFLALLALLGLTFGLAYVDLGALNMPLSLLIASIKAGLVAVFFMQLKQSSDLERSFAIAGILWLAILITLCLGDYFSRGWMSLPGHWPQ